MSRLTKRQKWICGIVLSLGMVSAVLGLFAEINRVKASQISLTSDGTCKYPKSPSVLLGVVAALVLLVAQVLVTVVGGCVCCTARPPSHPNSPANSNRSVAIICLAACWIAFLNAFALLMAGATTDNQGHQSLWFGECSTVKPLVFAGGSLLALATVILDVIYYLAACAAKASATSAQQMAQQIPLGQPYPGGYGAPAQPYYYPYGTYSYPPQPNQMPTDPNGPPPTAPPIGYPIGPGIPKPPHTNAN